MKRHLLLAYWLLLLVSTLAIGAVAFRLIDRERVRVLSMVEDSARNKGQTIAENLDLFVFQAKAGLMDALTSFPDAGAEVELLALKQDRQSVRSVFLYRPGLGLVIPAPDSYERRDIEPLLRVREGWIWGAEAAGDAATLAASQAHGSGVPAKDSYGSLKAERAEVRFANRSGQNPGVGFIATNSMTVVSNGNVLIEQQSFVLQTTPPQVPAAAPLDGGLNVPQSRGGAGLLQDPTPVATTANAQGLNVRSPSQAAAAVAPSALAAPPGQGWLPATTPDGKLRWFGWARLNPGGVVRGVELDWQTLLRTMRSAFPDRLEAGEGFVLRNPAGEPEIIRFPNGRRNESKLTGPDAVQPLVVLNVGTEMPGWTLAVYLDPVANFSGSFLLISSVLVAILVISVVLGGTMLLRQARREAVDAARKTTFVSNVSHELKTPLTTIRMYAELLDEGRVRDEQRKHDYLATIVGESQRLTRLVNNVLDFNRLEQGHKKYNVTDEPLGPLVSGVLEAQRPRLEEAGLVLEADVPANGAVRARTDRDAVEQVLLNLVDNALKYAADGRWLGVRVGEDGRHAILQVEDRGPGVPAEHQDRIFDMFHRVNDSITANQPGCGLGLSIARRLLRDQGGDLRYEPNTPHGARFVATLPLAEKSAAAGKHHS